MIGATTTAAETMAAAAAAIVTATGASTGGTEMSECPSVLLRCDFRTFRIHPQLPTTG